MVSIIVISKKFLNVPNCIYKILTKYINVKDQNNCVVTIHY